MGTLWHWLIHSDGDSDCSWRKRLLKSLVRVLLSTQRLCKEKAEIHMVLSFLVWGPHPDENQPWTQEQHGTTWNNMEQHGTTKRSTSKISQQRRTSTKTLKERRFFSGRKIDKVRTPQGILSPRRRLPGRRRRLRRHWRRLVLAHTA